MTGRSESPGTAAISSMPSARGSMRWSNTSCGLPVRMRTANSPGSAVTGTA